MPVGDWAAKLPSATWQLLYRFLSLALGHSIAAFSRGKGKRMVLTGFTSLVSLPSTSARRHKDEPRKG